MAVELGYESLYEPAADDACPSDGDIAHALKEPVPMAAVMQDLCWVLGIALQGVVALVLGPSWSALTRRDVREGSGGVVPQPDWGRGLRRNGDQSCGDLGARLRRRTTGRGECANEIVELG